jgi:hypothetical protein
LSSGTSAEKWIKVLSCNRIWRVLAKPMLAYLCVDVHDGVHNDVRAVGYCLSLRQKFHVSSATHRSIRFVTSHARKQLCSTHHLDPVARLCSELLTVLIALRLGQIEPQLLAVRDGPRHNHGRRTECWLEDNHLGCGQTFAKHQIHK